MDLSKFPTDLSNESSATLQAVQKLIMKELDQRGGFEGEVFTFIKKKEGKILNKDNKWIGAGKLVALFEFRGADKKVKDFMISAECRGAKEPVEDKVVGLWRFVVVVQRNRGRNASCFCRFCKLGDW
jgi:hypothetical protein